jgi:hypothetical protein
MTKIRINLRRAVTLYPILFAFFPILALYSQNMQELSITVIVIPLLLSLGLALLFLLLSFLIFRNLDKAAIFASIIITLFFSFGHVVDVIGPKSGNLYINGSLVGTVSRYLLLFWFLVFISSIYPIARIHRNLKTLTAVLGAVAIFMVLVSLVVIIPYQINRPNLALSSESFLAEIPLERIDKFPDVYYLVWDTFPSASTVATYYDSGISQLVDFLTERGFYIGNESHSNYGGSVQSLASSLNMQYLVDESGKEIVDARLQIQLLQRSKVVQLFKYLGYKYVNIKADWPATRGKGGNFADTSFYPPGLSGFSYLLTRTTIIRAIPGISDMLGLPSVLSPRVKYYKDTLYQLDKLSGIPNMVEGTREPVFVFAHIMIPHSPIVFDQDGEFAVSEANSVEDQKAQYMEQLVFCTKQIEKLVDDILSKSGEPPIIILQGDHGPKSNEDLYCFDSLNEEQRLEVNSGILNAYYVPDSCRSLLYPTISPVNTFRLIFNCCFGTNYKLLGEGFNAE